MELEARSSRGHSAGALSHRLRAFCASVGLSANEPPKSRHGAGRSSCSRFRKRYVTAPWQGKENPLVKESDSHRIRPESGRVAVGPDQRSVNYMTRRAGYIFAFLGTDFS